MPHCEGIFPRYVCKDDADNNGDLVPSTVPPTSLPLPLSLYVYAFSDYIYI